MFSVSVATPGIVVSSRKRSLCLNTGLAVLMANLLHNSSRQIYSGFRPNIVQACMYSNCEFSSNILTATLCDSQSFWIPPNLLSSNQQIYYLTDRQNP